MNFRDEILHRLLDAASGQQNLTVAEANDYHDLLPPFESGAAAEPEPEPEPEPAPEPEPEPEPAQVGGTESEPWPTT